MQTWLFVWINAEDSEIHSAPFQSNDGIVEAFEQCLLEYYDIQQVDKKVFYPANCYLDGESVDLVLLRENGWIVSDKYTDMLHRCRELCKDVVANGVRHDLTPTVRLTDDGMTMASWYNSYLRSINDKLVERAKDALAVIKGR